MRRNVWDGTNLAATLDGNDTLLQTYTWGPTGLTALTDWSNPAAPVTYLTVSDASGNIVELVDPTDGSVQASYHYGPYGEDFSATGPAAGLCPFGFAGGLQDSLSGLVYMLNRWYSPSEGRFLSVTESTRKSPPSFWRFRR